MTPFVGASQHSTTFNLHLTISNPRLIRQKTQLSLTLSIYFPDFISVDQHLVMINSPWVWVLLGVSAVASADDGSGALEHGSVVSANNTCPCASGKCAVNMLTLCFACFGNRIHRSICFNRTS